MKNLMRTVTLFLITVTGVHAQLPEPGFIIDETTAIVITDPQNDFLSPDGVAWGAVGQSVQENNTIENLETIHRINRCERT